MGGGWGSLNQICLESLPPRPHTVLLPPQKGQSEKSNLNGTRWSTGGGLRRKLRESYFVRLWRNNCAKDKKNNFGTSRGSEPGKTVRSLLRR